MKDHLNRDPGRFWAYVLIAVAALLAGLIVGQLGRDTPPGGSRIHWPHSVR